MSKICGSCGSEKYRTPCGSWKCRACQKRHKDESRSTPEGRAKDTAITRKGQVKRNQRDPWQIKCLSASGGLGQPGNQDVLLMKLHEQKSLCPLTGRRLIAANAELDHIIPKSRGGSNDLSNLCWVHQDANAAKGDLTVEEYRQLCWESINMIGKDLLEEYVRSRQP